MTYEEELEKAAEEFSRSDVPITIERGSVLADTFKAGAQWKKQRCDQEISDLKRQSADYLRACLDWVNAYDELKEKYEPTKLVESKAQSGRGK